MVRISIIYANKNIKTTLIDYFDSKIAKVNETSARIEEGVRKKHREIKKEMYLQTNGNSYSRNKDTVDS